jgi:hypothetical protein
MIKIRLEKWIIEFVSDIFLGVLKKSFSPENESDPIYPLTGKINSVMCMDYEYNGKLSLLWIMCEK